MSAPHYRDPQWRKARAIQRRHEPLRMPVGPVADHIRTLMAGGAQVPWIAVAAQTSDRTIHRILNGATVTVKHPIGARILGVTLTGAFASAPDTALVSAVGSRRRIEALLWKGWTHTTFKAWGFTWVNQILTAPEVTIGTHRKIAALFVEHHATSGPLGSGHRRAVRRGYMPPGAWDDIDDPAEVPDCGAEPSRLAWVEDAEHMAEAGESAEGAAVRLGRADGRSLGRALRHLGRQDLVDRFAANGARVS